MFIQGSLTLDRRSHSAVRCGCEHGLILTCFSHSFSHKIVLEKCLEDEIRDSHP